MWLVFVSTEKKVGRISVGKMQFPKLKPIKAMAEVIDARRREKYTEFIVENFGQDDYYDFSKEAAAVVGEWMANASPGDNLYLPQSDDVDRQILFYLSESEPREFGVRRATVTQYVLTSDEDDADEEDEEDEEDDSDDDEDDEDEKPRRRNPHGRH
jgi:hypothetical protein